MEEEDELALLDYRTPKGQLIKLLEQKIKKPEVDDTLGKVLDQFAQLVNEQTAFLDGGIFHMNFAEDALLLQSCGQYYSKRVDKLWDELMQFHTRMIKYDEITAKNCTDSDKREERKQEIARLEERLNRGKRKKIVLTESENEAPPVNGCFIFDIDQEGHSELFNNVPFPLPEEEAEVEEEPVAAFEYNSELFDEWRDLRLVGEKEQRRNGHSVLVGQYHRLRYRFKHYATPSSDDIIYDWSDPDEFNTREGRLISFHHIKHLFEYNDQCLLPDEDFTVAKLRLAFVLQKKWILKNKINPNAPYETFKDSWEQYQKEFFENEKRKIQNMPQSTPEELIMFYKALAKKEELAIQKVEKLRAKGEQNLPVISFENVIVAPVKEGYEGIFDPYIPEDFDTPHPVVDGAVEVVEEQPAIHLDGDHEVELSTLLENLSRPPDHSSQTLDKSRSDSGYFDGGFEADDESDHEAHPENGGTGADTPFEFDKENPENTENPITEPIENTTNPVQTEVPVTTEQSEPELAENDEAETANPQSPVPVEDIENDLQSTNLEPLQKETELKDENMNQAIKKFVKQATSDQDFLYRVLENSYFNQTDYLTTLIYDKPEDNESEIESLHGDQIMVYGCLSRECELKVPRQSNKRRLNNVETERKEDDVQKNKKQKLEQTPKETIPSIRRKLSQKQIAKLKKSLLEPVKEQKWESFFSLNYQVESGEGEINRVEYESDSDLDSDEDSNDDTDTDLNDADHADKSDNCTDLNVSGYHSDPDEAHESERPQSTPLPLSQDSGINMDTSLNETESFTPKEQESTEIQEKHTEQENLGSNSASADLLTGLRQKTGISREELAKQSPSINFEELTPYEQEREKVRDRVAEWKNFITPKLKQLDEHDFDIHEYGANIMNNMSVSEPKPFNEFVSGKSSAEVVRYFVSSLQLANTLNIEICGAKSGQLSNDTFALKLLNKERYHEHFQEYQAPSEESLKYRLKKVKEIRMENKKKQCTKRKLSIDEEYQPQSILKNKSSPKKHSSNRISSKRIKILNIVNVVSSTDQESTEQLNIKSKGQQAFDLQQPSTSWQADIVEQQYAIDSAISDIAQTPNRTSIDSGFVPSCDEDFLEQFDQLQQISGTALRSTPVKPQKILKISIARSDIFNY